MHTTPMRIIRTASAFLAASMFGGCALHPRPNVASSDAENIRIQHAHALAYEAAHTSDHLKAIDKYEEALQEYRLFPAAWNNLGALRMKEGQFLEAEQAFASAADISPSDPRPLYNRGLLWFKRRYPADARVFFRKALDRDPNYLPALRGAVRADMLLRDGTNTTLDNIRRAVMIEKDKKWLNYFESVRVRVQADLDLPERPGPAARGRPATDDEKDLFKQRTAPAHPSGPAPGPTEAPPTTTHDKT